VFSEKSYEKSWEKSVTKTRKELKRRGFVSGPKKKANRGIPRSKTSYTPRKKGKFSLGKSGKNPLQVRSFQAIMEDEPGLAPSITAGTP